MARECCVLGKTVTWKHQAAELCLGSDSEGILGAVVDRAQYFNDWTPDGLKGEYHQKDYVVMELEFTSVGYMTKMEADVLHRMTPQEYRWYGPIRAEERDSHGRLLLAEAAEVAEAESAEKVKEGERVDDEEPKILPKTLIQECRDVADALRKQGGTWRSIWAKSALSLRRRQNAWTVLLIPLLCRLVSLGQLVL
eukprot:s1168_g14.t1